MANFQSAFDEYAKEISFDDKIWKKTMARIEFVVSIWKSVSDDITKTLKDTLIAKTKNQQQHSIKTISIMRSKFFKFQKEIFEELGKICEIKKKRENAFKKVVIKSTKPHRLNIKYNEELLKKIATSFDNQMKQSGKNADDFRRLLNDGIITIPNTYQTLKNIGKATIYKALFKFSMTKIFKVKKHQEFNWKPPCLVFLGAYN
ncbi:hypothetical protein [[Mycoplasma] testudinis]|uniref:hypothetical protein n=1 Tax=[Mycoplasma] testudinis TaxID=33924 RepID=UPI000AFD4DB9|nr:hypothetical protein [[Mycoplasma] testudinis]